MKEEYRYCPRCATPLELGFIEGKDRRFCPNCDFIDYKNPLPVAVAIAVRHKRFLLIKRGIPPKKGAWGSPSGFIESGETAEEACLREMKEETGISGQVIKLVGIVRIEDKEVYGDMLAVMYLVKADDGEIAAGDEVEDARFCDIDELPDYFARRFGKLLEEIQNEAI